jgi:hypothetical protein
MAYPLVEVVYRDCWFEFTQPDTERGRADYLVSVVGFLLDNDGEWVSVASEALPEGDGFRAVTHLPVPVVQTITYLRR